MLQFLEVKKEYGQRIIVSIPELTIPPGIYWLKGSNGSGKTSLLKMISGLIPFSGSITLEGIDLKSRPLEYRKLVGSAEAEPVYPGFLTGRELVGFYQEILKATASQVSRLIDITGVSLFLHTPIGTYSSGMIKRLSLLLAFMGKPKLILLDEPLATLDADAAMRLPALMLEYQKEYGSSCIFSSHTALDEEGILTIGQLILHDQSIDLTP
jgi:ABC-2 type transport system ATP-binding protein